MAGFVFFDTETTGLRPGWDQIVHFAAIRTDADLNEIERFETRCRLQPYVVPHPMALLTNGLSIASLCDQDLPSHHQMVCDIGRCLAAWSPAILSDTIPSASTNTCFVTLCSSRSTIPT